MANDHGPLSTPVVLKDDWEKLAHHFADELVDKWHTWDIDDQSLASFMGLTDQQYAAWVECRFGEVLP